MRRIRTGVCGLVLAAALAGCGGKDAGAVVEGKVVKDGKPIHLGDSEGVTITLTDGNDKYTARVGEDGQFSVQKPAGGPIPYGDYAVAYSHYQLKSPYSKQRPFRVDKNLSEKWKVSGGESQFTIDLSAK